jgi:hypothetical protein
VTSDEQAESIRKRMSELRSEMTCDAQEVSRSAKAMTSPSYYVRKFPWATLAVAAGVGYMLIPKKKQSVTPDMQALAELIKNNRGRGTTQQAAEESPGMVKTLAVMGLSWAARAGMNYLLEQLTTAATKATAPQPNEQSPSPVEESSNVEQ